MSDAERSKRYRERQKAKRLAEAQKCEGAQDKVGDRPENRHVTEIVTGSVTPLAREEKRREEYRSTTTTAREAAADPAALKQLAEAAVTADAEALRNGNRPWTKGQVLERLSQLSIPPKELDECAERYLESRDKIGWKFKGSPIENVGADLQGWAREWRRNGGSKPANGNGRHRHNGRHNGHAIEIDRGTYPLKPEEMPACFSFGGENETTPEELEAGVQKILNREKAQRERALREQGSPPSPPAL